MPATTHYINDFNPRPRGEGDIYGDEYVKENLIFQSTPSWGGRLLSHIPHFGFQRDFNPRPRGEGD